MGLLGAFTSSTRVRPVTAARNSSRSSCQAPPRAAGRSGTRVTRAPRMAGCAVRLGHTGTTATTSSPAPTSNWVASIRAVTPDEVTAMRSTSTGPCSALA